MGTAAAKQKELYDRKIHGEKFAVGQLVWLCKPVVPRGNSRKLHTPWVGPYKVVKCISETVYRIQGSRAPRKRVVVHFDRLKPCSKGMRTPVDVNGKKAPTQKFNKKPDSCHLAQIYKLWMIMMANLTFPSCREMKKQYPHNSKIT